MKHTAYSNRTQTDVLFIPAPGSCRYYGKLADTVPYIENTQLLDPALWALFVAQFRIGNVDDHDHDWRSEYWGKMMRGACFTYAYTQNETLYRILENSVMDILTTQDDLGRINTYTVAEEFKGWDVWGRKYVLLGMQYFLEICKDDSLAEKIIVSMQKQADYILSKVGDGEDQLAITHTSHCWDGLAASSILEPFVRLYNLTGENRYLSFAEHIIRSGGTKNFNIFEAVLEGKTYPYEFPVTKAYEMISNFEGILEYYRVTGEEKYKQMVLNFARLVMESDITVIGCAGTTHELFDHSIVRQFDPAFDGIMQETCVTVTWMKFCHQLLCLTGDPIYADQIERSAYNALVGAININHHICMGQEFTFDSYSPLLNGVRGRVVGGRKDILKKRFWWGCCVAIGAAGTGLIPMTAAMPTRDGIALNLYLSGTYKQAFADGTEVTLLTETEYPKNGNITITVHTATEKNFALRLRIPTWSKDSSLSVNDQPIETKAGSYAVIDRTWKDGDVICLSLDMRTEIIYAKDIDPKATPQAICHLALRRGPIMLARDSSLGEDIKDPVTILDENGYAKLQETQYDISAQQQYQVQTEHGTITVIDYASAGQSWDPNLPITVWITTK